MYLEGKQARVYLNETVLEQGIKNFSQSGMRSYLNCPKEFRLYEECGGLLGMDDKACVQKGRKMDELILGAVEYEEEEDNVY